MSIEELENDIVTRVFDESFLNERLLTGLLHRYRDAVIEAERERCSKRICMDCFRGRPLDGQYHELPSGAVRFCDAAKLRD